MFKVINNKKQYIEFIKSVEDQFGCQEDLEYFFGFELKWDMETGEILESLEEYKGEVKLMPEKFPAVLYYMFDKEIHRGIPSGIRIFDWISFDDINKQNK